MTSPHDRLCNAVASLAMVAMTAGTPSSARAACAGDCNGDSQVSVDEIITLVNVALGELPNSTCPEGDSDGDSRITVVDILAATDRALNRCDCGFIAPRQCGGRCPSPNQICQPLPDDSGCACRFEERTPTATATPFTEKPTPTFTRILATMSPTRPPSPTPLPLDPTPTLTPITGCVAPPNGMVAWLTGDNTAADLSGSSNHGSLVGGATYAAGKVGAGFGLATISDFVQVANSSNLNFSGDFTIDAWIRTANASNARATIVDKRSGSNTNPVGYHFFLFQGTLGFQLADGQSFLNHVSPGPMVNDGALHHVAVTITRTSSTGGRLFVDGVLIHTFDPTSRPGSIANSANLRLAVRTNGSPQTFENFQGVIDEVELFDRALGGNEIAALFSAGSAGKCKSLLPSRTPTRTPTSTHSATATSTRTFTPTRTPPSPGVPSLTPTRTPSVTPTSPCGPPRSLSLSTGSGIIGGGDPHWSLTQAPNGTGGFPPAHPATIINTYGGWTAQSNSRWISANTTCGTTTGCPVGTYRYEVCWLQCSEVTSPAPFSVLADNQADVFVDNSLIVHVPGFVTPVNFSFVTVPGLHRLHVDVHNDPYLGMNIATPTGLNVSGVLSGNLQIVACPQVGPQPSVTPSRTATRGCDGALCTPTRTTTPTRPATPTQTRTPTATRRIPLPD